MKSILVPTDFSRSSDSALHLAIKIAQAQGAKILLLHVIQPPIPATPLPYVSVQTDSDVLQARSAEMLKRQSGSLLYAGNVDYELLTEHGIAIDKINSVARNYSAGLIIMGMSQKGGFERVIFGSTAIGVINSSEIPALVVPEDVRISAPISKITFATSYRYTNFEELRAIAELARSLDAELAIMHISTEENTPETEVSAFHRFIGEVSDLLPGTRLSAEFLTGADVGLRLSEYLENKDTSLLVMSTHRRTLLARIFGQSLTREALEATQVPVIVFSYLHKDKSKPRKDTDIRTSTESNT